MRRIVWKEVARQTPHIIDELGQGLVEATPTRPEIEKWVPLIQC